MNEADSPRPAAGPSGSGVMLTSHRLVLRQLMHTVLTRQRSLFLDYCRDLAEYRREQGFDVDQVVGALHELNRICITVLASDPESREVRKDLHDFITMNFRFGCDQIEDAYDDPEGGGR